MIAPTAPSLERDLVRLQKFLPVLVVLFAAAPTQVVLRQLPDLPPSCGYKVEATLGRVFLAVTPQTLYFHTPLLSAPVVALKLRAAMLAGSLLDLAEPKSERVRATFLFVIDIAVVVASVY